MRKVRNGRSQRGAPRLEALYRKFTEDHLGEAPIRHGDSVIIKNEVTAMAVNRVEPRDQRPSFSERKMRDFFIPIWG
jgi:hypothetical protein